MKTLEFSTPGYFLVTWWLPEIGSLFLNLRYFSG
jgi:hypothetical protein